MKKILWSVLGLGALLVGAQVAYTAPLTDTASQKFTVTVPKRVSITAPVAQTATLPDSSANLTFPAQTWQVRGNVVNGVAVTFVAQQPFTNTTDSSFVRDAKVTIAVASHTGPATWTVAGTGSAQTDFASAVNTATVSASSNKTGQAAFNLTVDFLTVDIAQVAAGDYETTVVGTVTEN